MAVYAIGDVQGCWRELKALLKKLRFRDSDELWLAGDLINRGPDSLKVLRKLRAMDQQIHIVLGNHDLHFLAIVFGGHNAGAKDTFAELLGADDVEDLAHWLRTQKLFYRNYGHVMTHAGVPGCWTVGQAQGLAREVESVIGQSDKKAKTAEISYRKFFADIYGNKPAAWSDDLVGMDRLRCVVNYLTRMRLLDSSGAMDFAQKGALQDAPAGLMPWFDDARIQVFDETLLFGHWASLDGETGTSKCIALDTGCVWGRQLTAYELVQQRKITQAALTES
jgi:bis(5'-nucleosyl)-tetraphosphatase (symmetrical)